MKESIQNISMTGLSISSTKRDYQFSMLHQHFHDTYELYYMEEGDCYYFIDKHVFYVPAGSVVFVNREQIHKTSSASSTAISRILLQLSPEVFRPFLLRLGIHNPDELFLTCCGVHVLSEENNKLVLVLLTTIREELQKKQDKYDLLVMLKVAELLLLIYRTSNETLPEHKETFSLSEKHNKIQEIIDYLSTHLEENRSLEQLAADFFISKSYLTRIFKETTGFTITEYQNLMRIRKAKKLLKTSSYSVTEIAALVGFDSITYFERIFKKLTGLSPKKYQKHDDRIPMI